MLLHLTVVGELLDELLVTALVTEETDDRALVGLTLVHRDDRIEQYLEVGTRLQRGMGGSRRSQMAAGREAHDTDVVGADMPRLGTVAHGAYGVLGVAHRNRAVALGHTVCQDAIGDALTVEIVNPVGAFVLHRQMGIASARTSYDCPTRRIFGQEHLHVGLAVGSQIDGQFARGLRLCGNTECRKEKE